MSQSDNLLVTPNSFRQQLLDIYNDAVARNQVVVLQQAETDPNKVFESGSFKSTTIALGSNPAVGSKPALVAPSIDTGEIGVDGINNPYTSINYSIDQSVIDGCSVVAFKLYRQEVPSENLSQVVENFNAADFDKISQGATKQGKFSQDNKAQHVVDALKTPAIKLNTNLQIQQQVSNQQNLGSLVNSNGTVSFPSFTTSKLGTGQKKLLATITYQDAQAAAKLKQVYVQTDNKVALSYTDNTVTYGTGYLYTMTSLSSTSEESAESPSLSMVVLNLNGINSPQSFTAKQVSALEVKLGVTVDPKDLIKRAYIFRRATEDLVFHPLIELENANNSMSYIDDTLAYLDTYIYRVILENVWGVLSEPSEVTVVCSMDRLLPQGRSNNLTLPILLASQDQNSDGIKLTIFPNDHRILYYTLERRNLTAGETVFLVPSNKTNTFWPLNQFFVSSSQTQVINSGTLDLLASGSLPSQASYIDFADPITFVDQVVSPDNYYQYRTAGYDIFGNVTGYGFASLAAHGKNTLRSPVNFTAELLRETPFRVQLTWKDDNEAALADQNNQAQETLLDLALQQAQLSSDQRNFIETMVDNQDLTTVDIGAILAPYNVQQAQVTAIQNQLSALQSTKNTVQFQLQRRVSGQSVYESFPYTQNNFVVDEVATPDAIPFTTGLLSGAYTPQSSSYISVTSSLSRSFGLPDFMQAQQVYQYRVCARTLDGQVSDFCDPITVVASAQISSPSAFSASLLNPKVTPIVVKLQWTTDPLKGRPDHWRVERKTSSPTEDYVVIGNAYLINEYFDRTAQIDNQYMYRIRSVSAAGDESDIEETRITT